MFERLVPTYGNWGGPGYSGGRRPKSIRRRRWTLAPPVDDVDEAFMLHDFDYEDGKYLHGDNALIERLGDPPVFSYAWLAKHTFRVMSKARELGILDPGVESNPGPRRRLADRLAHLPIIESTDLHTMPTFPPDDKRSLGLKYSLDSDYATVTSSPVYPVGIPGINATTDAAYLNKPIPFEINSNDIILQADGPRLLTLLWNFIGTAKPTLTGASMARIGVTLFDATGVGILDDWDNRHYESEVNGINKDNSLQCALSMVYHHSERIRPYIVPWFTGNFASGSEWRLSIIDHGIAKGLTSGYHWVPLTDRQRGIKPDGFVSDKDPIIRPWSPPEGETTPPNKPMPAEAGPLQDVYSSDESSDDSVNLDYDVDSEDIEDCVRTLIRVRKQKKFTSPGK